MGIIIFNDKASDDYGIVVEHFPEYQRPAREYDKVHIDGRNGDLIIDKGSYGNAERSYQIAFGEYNGDYTSMANAVSEWLHGSSGYCRLEDTYEPDFYREAIFSADVSFENIYNQAGRATISFNCKPQRFYKYGEESVIYNLSGEKVLYNPSEFDSYPLIKAYFNPDIITNSGFIIDHYNSNNEPVYSPTIWINHKRVNILDSTPINDYLSDSDISDEYLVIDTETMDVYYQKIDGSIINFNIYVMKYDEGNNLSYYFPTFISKSNNIVEFGYNFTKLEVIPRWWTI